MGGDCVPSSIYLNMCTNNQLYGLSNGGVYKPSAAVLSVPKGKFRSETGSHTSISPSRMMLKPSNKS
jgi:hypothetical protein